MLKGYWNIPLYSVVLIIMKFFWEVVYDELPDIYDYDDSLAEVIENIYLKLLIKI